MKQTCWQSKSSDLTAVHYCNNSNASTGKREESDLGFLLFIHFSTFGGGKIKIKIKINVVVPVGNLSWTIHPRYSQTSAHKTNKSMKKHKSYAE